MEYRVHMASINITMTMTLYAHRRHNPLHIPDRNAYPTRNPT